MVPLGADAGAADPPLALDLPPPAIGSRVHCHAGSPAVVTRDVLTLTLEQIQD